MSRDDTAVKPQKTAKAPQSDDTERREPIDRDDVVWVRVIPTVIDRDSL
jgi:hypothetical protein